VSGEYELVGKKECGRKGKSFRPLFVCDNQLYSPLPGAVTGAVPTGGICGSAGVVITSLPAGAVPKRTSEDEEPSAFGIDTGAALLSDFGIETGTALLSIFGVEAGAALVDPVAEVPGTE
jgi:hypothetical protein